MTTEARNKHQDLPMRLFALFLVLILAGFAIYKSEMTERLIREQAATEAKFLLTLDETKTGLMELSTLGQILAANGSAHVLLGYNPGELVGMQLDSLLPVMSDIAPHTDLIHKAFDKPAHGEIRTHVMVVACILVTKGGEPIFVRVRTYISRRQGRVFALINLGADVKIASQSGIYE